MAPNTRGNRISITTLYIDASHVIGKTRNLEDNIFITSSIGIKKRPITIEDKKIPIHITNAIPIVRT